MASGILPTLVGVITGALSTVALCVRQVLRYRAERERWRTVERLAKEHGSEVLDPVTRLAPELRDPSPVDAPSRPWSPAPSPAPVSAVVRRGTLGR